MKTGHHGYIGDNQSWVLDDDEDRIVEAVDDLGDPEDDSAGVLVQSGAQTHLVLESIIYYLIRISNNGITLGFVHWCSSRP